MKTKIILLALIVSCSLLISCKPGKEKLVAKIASEEQQLFNDSTKMLNDSVAESVLNSYLEYANRYPDDTLAAGYLFKAGDLANGMRHFKEATEIFEQFHQKYPEHRKAATSLFLRAFIFDSNLRDVEKAKMLYSEFIQKYPDHPLAPSAKASLDQLNKGISDDELVRMFQAKQDSLAKK